MLKELKKIQDLYPDNAENNSCIDYYEKQREHFLKQQISEVKNAYNINTDEEKILIGLFDSAERESTKKGANSFVNYRLLPIFKERAPEEKLFKNNPECKAAQGWLMIYWSTAWRQFAAFNKYTLSAKFGIGFGSKKNLKPTIYSMAIDDLISDLKEVINDAEKKVGFPLDEDFFINPKIDKDGILNIDKKKLKWLTQNNIGRYTQKYISEFKTFLKSDAYDINQQVNFWERPLSFAREIAHLRWKDRIEKLVERKQKNSPALTYQFFNQVNEITKRGISIRKGETEILNREWKIISGFGRAPGTTISTMEQITKSNLPLLSSITSHYLWRWFIPQVHKQHFLDLPTIQN